MLTNRPEFFACDLGAMALGAVPFSIYQTSSPEQIVHCVADSGAPVAIVERRVPRPLREGARRPARASSTWSSSAASRAAAAAARSPTLEALDPDFDVEPAVAATSASTTC